MGTLQQEIQQRRPFQSPAHEAVVALLRTADLVRRRMTAVVEPQGITLQQFNVLRILRGSGDEGLPTLEVADRMIEQTPGVTRLLDRLEAKGLVRRRRCSIDRRQNLCRITRTGLGVLEALDVAASREPQEVLKGLSQKDTSAFIQLLDAIRAAHRPTASR